MRQGRVYYKDYLAGILTETNEGDYVFQYDEQYVLDHPNDFITFTMPVTNQPYTDIRLFPFFEGLIPSGWVLSPAYDLLNASIVNPGDKEELALSLLGRKKKLKREHFEEFGEGLGLTDRQIQGVFKRFVKSYPKAKEWIDRSFLSNEMKMAYKDLIDLRYKQIGLV